MSRHQYDLPDATFLGQCVGLGRFAERHLPTDREDQLAVSHGFGHELECLSVSFGGYERRLYGRIGGGVLGHPDNRSKDSLGLHLGDELFGGFSADRIEWREI